LAIKVRFERSEANQMPKNPGDRMFWRFLELFVDKTPEQAYNYVSRIFSAAVIREHP